MASRAVKDYVRKERDKLIERLIDAALSVLHHDRSEGTDVDDYERDQLRKKFAETLAL